MSRSSGYTGAVCTVNVRCFFFSARPSLVVQIYMHIQQNKILRKVNDV